MSPLGVKHGVLTPTEVLLSSSLLNIVLAIRWYCHFYFNHQLWFIKLYCVCPYFCSFLSSISFRCSKISSFVISFLFEEHARPVSTVDLVATNSFSVSSSENVFISLSFLKVSFARYRIHSKQFFEQLKNNVVLTSGFRWEILCHSSWFCQWSYCALWLISRFCLFSFSFSLQNFNCGAFVWTSLGLICMLCMALLDLCVCGFCQIWKAFNHCFFKHSSSPLCSVLL